MKELLVSPHVLTYPCFSVLPVESSGRGLGAILERKQDGKPHPVVYASRTLSKHETGMVLQTWKCGVLPADQIFPGVATDV